MAEDEKKRLLEYNQMRESRCLLEGRSETCWLRPQKKHFPQSNRASEENYKEEKQEYDSGRTSLIKITPSHHKEKRHFPEKTNQHGLLSDTSHDHNLQFTADFSIYLEAGYEAHKCQSCNQGTLLAINVRIGCKTFYSKCNFEQLLNKKVDNAIFG